MGELACLEACSFLMQLRSVHLQLQPGESPRNFCKDEGIALQLRYTALPPAND